MGQACSKQDLHLKPVAKFQPIEAELPELSDEVIHDLSRDQQLLYKYCKAINTGSIDQNLVSQIAGPTNHARWLTLAIRLLILYTRTNNPSPGLVKISTFILQVYAPSWFCIKSNWHFTSDPSNLFLQMRRVVKLPIEAQSIAKPVVQRNAFFAHPSTMLCAGLASCEASIRIKAVETLRKFRSKPQKPPRSKVLNNIRKFVIPPLQWEATDWWNIINWDEITTMQQPQILSNLSDEEIESAITKPIQFPKFPCHTQSVERAVKLVTTVASEVEGQDARHGQILSIMASRNSRKDFATKKKYDYKAQ